MSGNHTFVGTGERWPYHGVAQKDAGDRQWTIKVKANSLAEALEKVELFRDGIESSPTVWLAPIHKVEQIR